MLYSMQGTGFTVLAGLTKPGIIKKGLVFVIKPGRQRLNPVL